VALISEIEKPDLLESVGIEEISVGEIVFTLSDFFLVLDTRPLFNLGDPGWKPEEEGIRQITILSGEQKSTFGLLLLNMRTKKKELIGHLPGSRLSRVKEIT
jgi:hypothetical protein